MLSRLWIGTCFCSFLATPLPSPLSVLPLLPTLKDGGSTGFSLGHLSSPVCMVPQAPPSLQSLQSSFTYLISFPSAPDLCVESWPLCLAFSQAPSQHVQSGIHNFCPRLAPRLVLCFSQWHPLHLLLKLEPISMLSFPFPSTSNHFSQYFIKFYVFNRNYYPLFRNCVHPMSLISKYLEKNEM